jgi:hypothetical protein
MKGKLIRPAFVALAIVGIALVAGGIAYAAIPDGSGVIHGCYQKNQGTLRVIDTGTTQTCSSSEAPLTWSQTGPQGQPGQQGQQGPPGPTGPSDVWSVDGCCAVLKNIAPFDTWVTVATTSTLPAGSYSVESEIEIENTLSTFTDYACDLVDSEANIYQDTRFSSSDWVTIPDQAVITLASPDTISLSCFASQPGAEAFNWKLAAIKIGTVHS